MPPHLHTREDEYSVVTEGETGFRSGMAIAERYGLQFGRPDWLPDLLARYNLNPPPVG